MGEADDPRDDAVCRAFFARRWKIIHVALTCLVLISLASFGVYYALFGAIVIGVAAVAGFAKNRNPIHIRQGAFVIGLISFGVILNIAPNLTNNLIVGRNSEVAQRIPAESEIFALKLRQLILPRVDHRVESLAALTKRFTVGAMTGYYELSAPLGVVGALGFLFSGAAIVLALVGRNVDYTIRLLALLTWILFLFGTIGGFGALFAGFISPSIRGWDRISIFIGFGAITVFLLVYQWWLDCYFSKKLKATLIIISAFVFLALAVFDQNVDVPRLSNEITLLTYKRDRNFVQAIEHTVPSGSAIYQLPYIAFPEEPPLFRLFSYEPAAGFLHSSSLSWSWGGMKGREGDLFYRALAKESVEKQLEVIKNLGFTGIYVDRRGFVDNAQYLIERLTILLGVPPLLTRADGEVVFFKIDSLSNVNLRGLSGSQIMQKVGYVVDKLGKRYSASFADGIDFTRPDWPDFVREVNGLSVPEQGGRWSDANIAPTVRIDFISPLPQNFTLVLTAFPFDAATDKYLVVRIGSRKYQLRMQTGIHEMRVPINLSGEQVDFVELLPPNPTSPRQLGLSTDSRKLGVGLVRLRLEE